MHSAHLSFRRHSCIVSAQLASRASRVLVFFVLLLLSSVVKMAEANANRAQAQVVQGDHQLLRAMKDAGVCEGVQKEVWALGATSVKQFLACFRSVDTLQKFFLMKVVKAGIVNDVSEEEVPFCQELGKLVVAYEAILALKQGEEPGKQGQAKKVDASKRAEMEKFFEQSFPGAVFGSDRTAPSNALLGEALQLATPGKVGSWIPWKRITSREDEVGAELGQKNQPDQPKDGDASFKGGIWKAEAICRLRAKAFASAGVCHLASITKYDQGLFDAALDRPALDSMRPPTVEEVMAVDRRAMEEAFRLVAAEEGGVVFSFCHSAHSYFVSCQAPWTRP